MPKSKAKKKLHRQVASAAVRSRQELFYIANPLQDQFTWWSEAVNAIKTRLLQDLNISSGMHRDLVQICYGYTPAEEYITVRTVGPRKELNVEAFAHYIRDGGVYSIPVECSCCQKVSKTVVSGPNVSQRCSRLCVFTHGNYQLCRECIEFAQKCHPSESSESGYYRMCSNCSAVYIDGRSGCNPSCVSLDSLHYSMDFNLSVDPESLHH